MTLFIELWSSEMYALAKFATIVLVIVGVVRFISSIRDGQKEDKKKAVEKKEKDEKDRKREEFLNTLTPEERQEELWQEEKDLMRKEKYESEAYHDYMNDLHNN